MHVRGTELNITVGRVIVWSFICHQTSDEEAEGIQRSEADDLAGQVVNARPVADDQEDATVSEGTEPLLNPSAPG